MDSDIKTTVADAPGRIEQHGVNFIPEADRHSRPANIFWIMLGSCVTFPLIVLGWIPIAFGLNFWQALSAVFAGAVVGALLLAPMSLLSPKTGTNNPIGSSAHFGIVGRIVGSVLAMLISILFTALAVWTGGDALAASFSRLFGLGGGPGAQVIWYTVIALFVLLVAVYGHSTMLRLQKISAPVAGAVMIIGLIVLWPMFEPGKPAAVELAFGSFWPTWVAGAVPTALAVMGYSLAIGDWTRYISPQRYTSRQVASWTILGGVVGMGGPVMWGTFTASTLQDPAGDYVVGLVAVVPLWFVAGIAIIGLCSGAAQGTVNMYSTGLDLSSIFPKVKRVPATVFVGVVSYAVVLLGVFVGSLIDNLTTLLDLLSVGFAAFVIVIAVGYWNHRGQYDSHALQAFSRGETGGRYWFVNGWNWRAVTAFIIGTILGLLSLSTAWYQGPLVEVFGGIAFGFLIAAAASALVYTALLYFFPEDGKDYVTGAPRIARRIG
ncbi:MAG: cytosine permease [Microbacterium sp.]